MGGNDEIGRETEKGMRYGQEGWKEETGKDEIKGVMDRKGG